MPITRFWHRLPPDVGAAFPQKIAEIWSGRLSSGHFAVKFCMNRGVDKHEEPNPAAQREARARKLIRVEIERPNQPAFSAIVTNLSEQGMGGRTEGHLEPFDLITIVKKGYGRISGEVRWTEGQNFGVLFAEPVNVDLFNFTDHNKQQHFVKPASEGHVWTGFKTASSTKRPGLTARYSRR